jgi:hypothetical protein
VQSRDWHIGKWQKIFLDGISGQSMMRMQNALLKRAECGGCRVHQDAGLAVRYSYRGMGNLRGVQCALRFVQVHGVGRCSAGVGCYIEDAGCRRVQGARRCSSKHVATVPASSEAVESEGRQMKQC